MHPVYKGPHISDRHVTFLEILFQNIYMCTFAGIASEENNSRSSTLISTLGLFLFIRHYLRIPIWFQILHLLICLNSAGCFAWCHVHALHKSSPHHVHSNAGSKLQALRQQSLMHQTIWLDAQSPCSSRRQTTTLKTLTQACPQECPKGTSAFNGQLIHGILQFTMIIALRCTLHQHVNQDICCWNYLCTLFNNIAALRPVTKSKSRLLHR